MLRIIKNNVYFIVVLIKVLLSNYICELNIDLSSDYLYSSSTQMTNKEKQVYEKLTLSKEEAELYKKGFTCNNPETDCSSKGICNKNNTDCICYKEHATFYKENILHYHKQTNRCNYKMTKMIDVLILAIFGFGLFNIFLGNYIFGIIKFAYYFLVCFYTIKIGIKLSIDSTKNSEINSFYTKNMFTILVTLFFNVMCISIWYIDILFIITNVYSDKNEVKFFSAV